MSGELAIRTETSMLRLSESDVLDAFLSGRNANTLEAYVFDLSDFARFVNAPTPSAALDGLLELGHGGANRVVLAYKASMTDRKLATANIARRIASLRSMVKLARQTMRVVWLTCWATIGLSECPVGPTGDVAKIVLCPL